MQELGANFIAGANKADHIERDGQIITGQNPASSLSIAEAVIAAEFPVTTFLENIAVDESDFLFATSYEDGCIYKVNAETGASEEFARVDGYAAGIAFEKSGDLLVAGSAGNVQTVYRIGKNGWVENLITLPQASGKVFASHTIRPWSQVLPESVAGSLANEIEKEEPAGG